MDFAQYKKMYEDSIRNPEAFWGQQAERLHWFKKWDKVKDISFKSPVSIKWFEGGVLNVSYNCIDRHLATRGDKIALIWEADEPKTPAKKVTYKELHERVCKFANILKRHGVQRGDRVTIYMPMILEATYAMLACARIGAIHSVIFGGFAPDSIADRIIDCESEFVITADEGFRGSKIIPLKKNVDQALKRTPKVRKVLVIKHSGNAVNFENGRDLWYHEEVLQVDAQCEAEKMNAEDPLFLLYTSGSTGKPKAVLHTTGGYLLFSSFTHEYVFDLKENDIFWCTADVGWVTGHSYLVYGPLANGATSLMFEGVPHYPSYSRFWEVIDKHQVSIFYTAPTAIRALMREGDAAVKKCSRKSLRLLGSVGEPINHEAWHWYHKVVGEQRCPIVDTWWQTETGGILISPLPGAMELKPGSATLPFFGIKPVVLTPEGERLEGACEGVLAIEDSWPGQMRTVYKDHPRFEQTYFASYKSYYFTGDGCRRDEDGYYWITGRVDDVLNVSGHRIGTAEIESALVGHAGVSEAAVVGYPHDIKGTGVYAFVTLKTGLEGNDEIKKELDQWVRKEIGAIASPDLIQWANSGLPKTRSGKIMRRILRKIAENHPDQLGDISTLADPSVVEDLVKNRLLK
ncbi:MAG: acetate--CoA ligase [Pseudobdellovibrionaceae bacterium]